MPARAIMPGESDPTTRDRPAAADAAPTVALTPGASASSTTPELLPATTGGSLRTAEATLILAREEATRTRALLRLVGPLSALGLAALLVPAKEAPFRGTAAAVFAATLAVTLWLLLRFRNLERFDPRLALLHAMFCVASVLTAALYVGIFSPTIMGGCVGVYFFALSDSKLGAWLVYATLAGGYAVLAALGIAGLLPLDRAIVGIESPDLRGLVALTLMAEIFLALTFGMARKSRQATREAFERLERAAMQIRQREALLDEARADLDAARAANLGRFSDRTVGDYAVGEIIGRGAMGEVYRAEQLSAKRAVALKFLNPAVLGDAEMLERFFREAKVASALRSPHVVEVLGMGRAEDGSPFIAMELLRGMDLAERLREQKRLELSEVIEILAQVGEALAAADRAGIVHRDIKPQNLFLVDDSPRRLWKVLDFGVSKVRELTSQLTQGAIIGTPSYMSPEQARGLDVDHRSDVFSLGVIAYRCLTGRPAFTAPDSVLTVYNVVHVQPSAPTDVAPHLGADVERVLALGLAKDRERRFSSASMLAAALADAARDRLDARLRADADALIATEPWGSEVGTPRR
ncbi:MAG: serine/threonine protein kinase [Polyangiaceae bacterium]|nr:serine/threonine protein kinase [Polyangiaceae bacterium]MCL4755206.1 serine/threonine protein kinase [Myxococcales bacterium]